MIKFESDGHFFVDKEQGIRWKVFTGKNPYHCWNFNHLIGQYILIDRWVHRCVGVESFSHMPPYGGWNEAEKIGIAVEWLDKFDKDRFIMEGQIEIDDLY